MFNILLTYLQIGIAWAIINVALIYSIGKDVKEEEVEKLIDDDTDDPKEILVIGSYTMYNGILSKRFIIAITLTLIAIWPISALANLYNLVKFGKRLL